MSHSSTHLSLAAVQELSRRVTAPAARSARSPNAVSTFLVRQSPLDAAAALSMPQALLLVPRPGIGIAGIELTGRTHPFIATDALSRSRRKRLLQAYMMRKGFRQQPSAEELTATRFLLLHTNHLVANALGATLAMPVYAHSLSELVRLSSREFHTLEPAQCLVSRQFVEWDSWREVVAEPGWVLHMGGEHVAHAAVSGALRPEEIPLVTDKAALEPLLKSACC